MSKVIASPSKYIQGPGELKNIAQHYLKLGSHGTTIILDPLIFDHYAQVIEKSFQDANIHIALQPFNGECSKVEVSRLQNQLDSSHDVIIGIGGGKTLDTAKAVAYDTDLPVMIVPTIASTDAPCSALSVLYTEDGEFDQYLFLKNNPNLVLVDSELISKAPTRLLVSGMGDALATYFEARACHASRKTTIAGGVCSLAALNLAKLCYDTLLSDGLKAKLASDCNTVSEALENIIEANTYLSGVGFESGGLAAAHAIHNGFTILEQCHHMYHGEKVAFGTIVQLVLENAELSEIFEVINFCKQIGLPTTLAELGLTEITDELILNVAKASCVPTETIHNMPFNVTPEAVFSAILVADQLGK